MKIFISHSSKNKKVVDFFVDKILILGCGINEKEIFCSSVEGLGITTGLDFREHIKETLLKSDYSFLFISNEYKESDICLNEMGASWAQDSVIVKPFIFPNIGFDSLGTLYSVKQVAKLDNSYSLDELFQEITEKYNLQRIIARWSKAKKEFLDFLSQEISNIHTKDDYIEKRAKEYFSKFLGANVNMNSLLLQAHPTLIDCKIAFSNEYFRKYFDYYCKGFEVMLTHYMKPMYPERKHYRLNKARLFEILNDNSIKLPGGMKMIAEKFILNNSVDFYSIEFLENKYTERGIRFSVFCYINDRWVFFPKPYFADFLN
ncbi:toll/interleukin-1 receptor domain-containing protein [Kordia jejudonensis]|uniref:toll/interleukin-1 receptor domain-containing protein n=1 Tax=Kordia jejudonensis TaxID=1348245 RepID=UPI00069C5826|nr:toll/interleukin-1 receptor domain-containing protein [Kordia jejudonensis]